MRNDQVGGGLKSRTNSASGLSMSSIGGLVELHRSLSARSGLTPPPRFLSMKDTHGNEVVSELSGSLESTSDSEEKARVQPGPAKSGRHRHRRNSNLPSMSPSRSSSSLASSHGHGGKLPSKYEPLDPIKTREGSEKSHHSRHRAARGHIGRRRRSCSD